MVLRVNIPTLNRIEANYKSDGVEECLRKVLEHWLNNTANGFPSWELLVEAIASPVGGKNCALASKIATNHNGECCFSFILCTSHATD